jgi:aryl-alcohol dehydrogenase-like predicted oxidoreductase
LVELRNLGRSGLKVSSVGLGGNTFGRTADDAESVRIVRRAIELGVTFIDTADVYAEGRSEQLVGQAVADRRQEVVIATKCGLAMPGGPKQRGLSRRWIRQAIEDSLRRLGMDYVDLYQAHFPDDETPLEETLRAMDDLVRQGKTRHIGCSNYTASDLGRALGISERLGLAPWVSAQNRWNLLDGLEDPLLPSTCRELGVGIIPLSTAGVGHPDRKVHQRQGAAAWQSRRRQSRRSPPLDGSENRGRRATAALGGAARPLYDRAGRRLAASAPRSLHGHRGSALDRPG